MSQEVQHGAKRSFGSLPAEILSLIFQSCDTFSDVVSMAATCRTIHSVWLSEHTVFLWVVGLKVVAGLQLALTAVRATSLVQEAHQHGVLLPTILLPALSAQRPILGEWKRILNLRHMVRCFERTFLFSKHRETSFYQLPSVLYDTTVPPSDLRYLQAWRENFHVATYRAFILSAVLSRSYQEPFFSSKKPERFLEQLIRAIDEGEMPHPLSPEDVEHLCKFPVYDLEAYENMGPAFDAITDWLLKDCESQILARNDIDLKESNHAEGPLFREIARVMVVHSHLFNGGNGAYFQYPDFAKFHPDFIYVDLSGPTRTAYTVPMGDFRVHKVEMGASVQSVDTVLPHIRQLPIIRGPKIPMLSVVLELLYSKSGRMNYRTSGVVTGPSPEPPLQIFEYIFRKQFNLVFRSDAFESFYGDHPYESFSQVGDIFGNTSEMACPVQSAFPAPVLSYREIVS